MFNLKRRTLKHSVAILITIVTHINSPILGILYILLSLKIVHRHKNCIIWVKPWKCTIEQMALNEKRLLKH